MKIVMRASGGFAGLEASEVGRFDTEELPPAQRRRVEDLINRLVDTAGEAVGADLMHYELEIEDATGRRQIAVDDTGEPDSPFQQLLAELASAGASG